MPVLLACASWMILFPQPFYGQSLDGVFDLLDRQAFEQAAEHIHALPNGLVEEDQKRLQAYLKQHSPQGNWIPFLNALAEKAGANGDFLFFLAQALWRTGDTEGALRISAEAVAADPDDIVVVYKCAAIAKTLGKLETAKERIQIILNQDADHPDALFLLGSIHAEAGENEAARKTLQSVIETHPKHFRSLYELGIIEIRLGNDEAAVNSLRKAIEVYPFFREAYNALRTPLSRLGKKEEFEQVQQQIAHMRKWNPDQYNQLRYMFENAYTIPMNRRYILAQELTAVRQYDHAKQYLTELEKNGLIDDSLRMMLAQLHYHRQEFRQCLQHLEQIGDPSITASERYIGIQAWSLLGSGERESSQKVYDRYKDKFAASPNFAALGKALAQAGLQSLLDGMPPTPDLSAVLRFQERSKQAGLDVFQHRMGHADKRWIVDAMGSGVAVADYDADGDGDLYFVNGGPDLNETDSAWKNRLFRNDGGVFVDVTERANVGDTGWGMCAVFGDINNDGRQDLFVGNYGENVLYLNNGDGTFIESTRAAGLTHEGYAAAAVFGDVDLDGDLDLFVGNYVDFDPKEHGALRDRYHGFEVMKGPMGFSHQEDLLYINDGTGKFIEEGSRRGIRISAGRAMGAILTDLDLDGDLDLYVANDSTYNHVLMNDGKGFFEDQSFFSGGGVDESGREGASMGVAAGDYNNDGWMDLYVTAYEQEADVLYHNQEGNRLIDLSGPLKLSTPTYWLTTWGTGFCDFDADGYLDIYTVNGHTYPQVEALDNNRTYAQGVSFYHNQQGKQFLPIDVEFAGKGSIAGRGSALLDYDDDGDMDIVINCIDGRARLLENIGQQGNWLKIKLGGSSAQSFGARVVLRSGDQQWTRVVEGGSSYLSQNTATLHFGLGKTRTLERITVYWMHRSPTILDEIQPNQTLVIPFE